MSMSPFIYLGGLLMQIFSLEAFLTLFGLFGGLFWPLHESSSGYNFKKNGFGTPRPWSTMVHFPFLSSFFSHLTFGLAQGVERCVEHSRSSSSSSGSSSSSSNISSSSNSSSSSSSSTATIAATKAIITCDLREILAGGL